MRYAWLVVHGFLQDEKFSDLYRWLTSAASARDIHLEIKKHWEFLPDISQNTLAPPVKSPDFVLFWDKDVHLATALENLGLPVFNSAASIALCDDKLATFLALKDLPLPKTIPCPFTFENLGFSHFDFLDDVVAKLGLPLVMKETRGSFGNEVYLVHSMDEMVPLLKKRQQKSFLFQELVASSHGQDLRMNVVGQRVVSAMRRFNTRGDFRSNIALGASAQPYAFTPEQENLALKACRGLGLDFAGVDLLFGADGAPLLCEVNSNAHFKGIFDTTGVNVAVEIIEHIFQKIYT